MPEVKYIRWLPFIDGITLPPFGILIEKQYKDDSYLYWHELGHWDQYQEWGLLKFYWMVAKDYIDGRQDSDFIERDADKRGEKLRKENKGSL